MVYRLRLLRGAQKTGDSFQRCAGARATLPHRLCYEEARGQCGSRENAHVSRHKRVMIMGPSVVKWRRVPSSSKVSLIGLQPILPLHTLLLSLVKRCANGPRFGTQFGTQPQQCEPQFSLATTVLSSDTVTVHTPV